MHNNTARVTDAMPLVADTAVSVPRPMAAPRVPPPLKENRVDSFHHNEGVATLLPEKFPENTGSKLPGYSSNPFAREDASFIPLQEWEGYIDHIEGDTFIARLLDVTLGDTFENEEVELGLSDLDPADHDKVKLGAIFRFTVGYQTALGRPRIRGYQIYFRNVKPIGEAQMAAAAERGARIAAKLRVD